MEGRRLHQRPRHVSNPNPAGTRSHLLTRCSLIDETLKFLERTFFMQTLSVEAKTKKEQ